MKNGKSLPEAEGGKLHYIYGIFLRFVADFQLPLRLKYNEESPWLREWY